MNMFRKMALTGAMAVLAVVMVGCPEPEEPPTEPYGIERQEPLEREPVAPPPPQEPLAPHVEEREPVVEPRLPEEDF